MKLLRGWKEIADYLRLSVPSCKRRAGLSGGGRLPVFRDGRIVSARLSDLDAWVDRVARGQLGS